MNRRGFLSTIAAGFGGLLLPEAPRVRVYSFAAPWMQEQARFERGLAESARTGVPLIGEFRVHRPVTVPDRAMLVGSLVYFTGKGAALCIPPESRARIFNNVFSVAPGLAESISRLQFVQK